MPSTVEGIQADIDEAATPGFRGRIIARGQARAMIWRDGVLPPDAPAFSPQLSYELHSYGYCLLGLGLRLREMDGDPARARIAFEQAGTALEAVMAKGDRGDSDRDFHFVMAAAAYHLARYSARAYSLLAVVQAEDNFSPVERALALLMLRDFNALENTVLGFRTSGVASDERIAAAFQAHLDQAEAPAIDGADEDSSSFIFDGLDLALTDNFFGALSIFLLAVERGERPLLDQALARLREGQGICAEINLLPQWWSHRIALHLLSDLWDSTFHEKLPKNPAGGEAALWPLLRELFIASLLRRRKAEVDLWPSQIAAAARAVDQSDDLVVSLPTSAGKTRISELCILRCLAGGKRVVFVTPLRALSAQTEATLQRTFGPLGKTISALYGSIGVSGFDEDAIRLRHIVVATPEKLDFALRNDPSLLDDVGLLVFDEGHMIGINEREVRYEVQIQRLLKRPDAHQRRIVCLSAILPDGHQLDDFANWLRRDQPGGLVKDDWRPTRLRFGEIIWNGQVARLNLRVGEERPFVPRFFTGFVPPVGKRRNVFPCNLGELCLATAWRLVDDGQSVLVFCPVRAHVEPFADRIVDLHKRGALRSLLTVNEAVLSTALTLGQEWLGADHPILKCLKLGVAIHHGALPSAFRKEVERLLRDGVLKVTISSPTLAQGLNLSATAVIIHSLFRNRERIETSEFKNVIGRAGRAYIDVEGLVLYPIFDNATRRLQQWEGLIADLGAREMESGLVRLLLALVLRMHRRVGGTLEQLIDYVTNNAAAWTFPELPNERAEDRERALADWVMMYVKYPLSLRNVEDLLFERGIDICHETVRLWWNRFGPMFAAEIRKKRVDRMRADTHWRWHLDEVYVKINGEMRYLWRAVDHEGEVLESFVTTRRDKAAALAFIKKAMKRHGRPQTVVTDGLRSYGAAMKVIGNADRQEVGRWLNNRAENSHQPFRRRERAMERFRRMKTLQKFVAVHGTVHNHFNQERRLISRDLYRKRRSAALAEWRAVMG